MPDVDVAQLPCPNGCGTSLRRLRYKTGLEKLKCRSCWSWFTLIRNPVSGAFALAKAEYNHGRSEKGRRTGWVVVQEVSKRLTN